MIDRKAKFSFFPFSVGSPSGVVLKQSLKTQSMCLSPIFYDYKTAKEKIGTINRVITFSK